MFHEDSFDLRSFDDRSWLFDALVQALTEYLVSLQERSSTTSLAAPSRVVRDVQLVGVATTARKVRIGSKSLAGTVKVKEQTGIAIEDKQRGTELRGSDRVVHFTQRDDENTQEARDSIQDQQRNDEIQRTKP